MIVLFVAVLFVQIYMLFLIEALIKEANDDYSKSILSGVEYEITERIKNADRFLMTLAENRNLHIYISEKDEKKRCENSYDDNFNDSKAFFLVHGFIISRFCI